MFQVSSNLLYLCAAIVAGVNGKTVWSAIMSSVTVCSVLYHTGHMPREIAMIMAFIAFTYGIYTYASSKKASGPYLVPILTLSMISCLAIHKKSKADYDAIHPWAHVFGGLAAIAIATI